MSTIRERVDAGAALLDREEPGWEDKIDLDTLKLHDPCRCVLGQVFGLYSTGARVLDLNIDASSDHAFEVSEYGKDSYTGLTRAWKALIRARRAEAESRQVQAEGAG